MNAMLLLSIAELLAGMLINIFIGKLAKWIFRKDGTSSRLPLRVLGIYLIINGASRIFHI
ncbi:hypothetical protein DCC85_05655 [Paenibacillus sp. CAA11]|uniref:hypothetical protein n=1 Tax=Paenibacillus sp. CAA11 TaxID=1532905 RepID=UPI000D351F50|nr:hypothetical protein [Paenibacillus sp. CAA11]AWB43756.1 hypothetical protein DCC85_05655 [Paenibacillus sp. CAA11]